MAGRHHGPLSEGVSKENRVRGKPYTGTMEPLNHEQERIQKWLKQVHFQKTLFGGVDEADVWKKIAELNTLYEAALSAERARFDALLSERCASADHGKAGGEGYG